MKYYIYGFLGLVLLGAIAYAVTRKKDETSTSTSAAASDTLKGITVTKDAILAARPLKNGVPYKYILTMTEAQGNKTGETTPGPIKWGPKTGQPKGEIPETVFENFVKAAAGKIAATPQWQTDAVAASLEAGNEESGQDPLAAMYIAARTYTAQQWYYVPQA